MRSVRTSAVAGALRPRPHGAASERAPSEPRAEHPSPLRQVWGVFLTSRLLVAGVAALAALSVTPSVLGAQNYHFTRDVFRGWPLGGLFDRLFSPLSQWDAGWYLLIAHHGYSAVGGGVGDQAAFFPLFPLLTRIVAAPLGASAGAILISSYVVSLSAFMGALYLLYRLVELELGREFALPAITFLAFSPGATYFGAPYTESLFLLFAVGAFYAARQERWAWAGVLAGAASGTRLVGLAVGIGVLTMYLYGPRGAGPGAAQSWRRLRPRYRLERNVLWLGLAPAGLVAFSVYMAARFGDALAWSHAQPRVWNRQTRFPLETVWNGVHAAASSVHRLTSRATAEAATSYDFSRAHDVVNLLQIAVLVLVAIAIVGVLRRLPLAYGIYCVAGLLFVLSSSASRDPLVSLHRYVTVLFPMFMWLALWSRERLNRDRVLACFALVLGAFTAVYASGHWLV